MCRSLKETISWVSWAAATSVLHAYTWAPFFFVIYFVKIQTSTVNLLARNTFCTGEVYSRLWDAQGSWGHRFFYFIRSTGVWRGLQRLYLSLVHMRALRSNMLYALPCSSTPSSPAPDTNKASGSLLVSACQAERKQLWSWTSHSSRISQSLLPCGTCSFGPHCRSLCISRKWHQQLGSFSVREVPMCSRLCYPQACWFVWIWNSLEDCICTSKYI